MSIAAIAHALGGSSKPGGGFMAYCPAQQGKEA